MCSEPITQDGVTFACRKCNDCIAARKNDWVARSAAEKAVSAETMVLNLTYRDNTDGTKPISARAFRYKDVQDFFKQLRYFYTEEYGKGATGEISYLIAGEKGSRRGRVHWHLILFGKRPFSHLGEWSDFYHRPQKGPKISPHGKKTPKYFNHWSLWDHGHIVVQEPDEGGIQYVCKYIIKDQFNAVKSKGTMREAKSENHGASYFRQSKGNAKSGATPIGDKYLLDKCNAWQAKLVVPPKLEIKIPEYSGFWWPKGRQREMLLQRLRQINQECIEKTGRDAPQWSSLLESVVRNEKDWEALAYGEINIPPENPEYLEREIREKQDNAARVFNEYQTRGRCGKATVCRACWRGFGRKKKAEFRTWFEAQQAQYRREREHGATNAATLNQWHRDKRQINPHCTLKHEHEKVFPARNTSEFGGGPNARKTDL